jgi:hypothetical protein
MSSAPEPIKATNIGVADIVAPPIPPPSAEDENVLYELEVRNAELEKALRANEAFRQDIHGRARWGSRVFWLLIGWLLAVIGVMIFQGFNFRGFKLDNSIIITFITTTTINVLSLGYIVANYLFPKPKP